MSLLLKFETAACVKQVLVTPKTFPKKKNIRSAHTLNPVAIARKKIKISRTA